MMNTTQDIDSFIIAYPAATQEKLHALRAFIHQEVPEAQEKIAYGIPTFTYHGNLVHFSAYEHHIGFYPGAAPIAQYADELKEYETAKGTVRFPLDKPLPYPLIKKLIHAAVARNMARAKKY